MIKPIDLQLERDIFSARERSTKFFKPNLGQAPRKASNSSTLHVRDIHQDHPRPVRHQLCDCHTPCTFLFALIPLEKIKTPTKLSNTRDSSKSKAYNNREEEKKKRKLQQQHQNSFSVHVLRVSRCLEVAPITHSITTCTSTKFNKRSSCHCNY